MSLDFEAETDVKYPGLNGKTLTRNKETKIRLYTENFKSCVACLLVWGSNTPRNVTSPQDRYPRPTAEPAPEAHFTCFTILCFSQHVMTCFTRYALSRQSPRYGHD